MTAFVLQSHQFSEIWNVSRFGFMETASNPFSWVSLYQIKKHLRIGHRLITRQEILHHCVTTQKPGAIFWMSSTKLVKDTKYASNFLFIFLFIQLQRESVLKNLHLDLPVMQVISKYLAEWVVMFPCVRASVKFRKWKPHYPFS